MKATTATRQTSTPKVLDRHTAAAALFCASFVFFQVQETGGNTVRNLPWFYLQIAIFLALSLIALSDRAGALPRFSRFMAVVLLLCIPGAVLSGTSGGPLVNPSAYLRQTIVYLLVIAVTALYALFLYREANFVRAFWLVGLMGVVLSLAGYVAFTIGGPGIVINATTGTGMARLQGFGSEPSALAPLIAALLLLAWRNRRWGWFIAVICAGVLTRSPTVLLTMLASAGLWKLLQPGSIRNRIVALTLIVLFGVAAWAATDRVDYRSMIASGEPSQVVIGRTVSGLDYLRSGGEEGTNDRGDSTEIVVEEVKTNGWLIWGRGLGASDVYFTAKYPPLSSVEQFPGVLPNALPVVLLFDLGLLGLVLVIGFSSRACWRMRSTAVALVLYPFFVAATINSAQGLELYKFVLLGILVYGLGRGPLHPLGVDRGDEVDRADRPAGAHP